MWRYLELLWKSYEYIHKIKISISHVSDSVFTSGPSVRVGQHLEQNANSSHLLMEVKY